MSSQSDNEKSKPTDDETHSDKESFSDEYNDQKKDRKKKLKTKELLRSPAKVKVSPGASASCFFGKDNIVLHENSDSNSDEKRPKELLRSPAKAKVAKANPEPSGSCFFGKDPIILEANLDSNSDEKLVGVVGDNIKHLNLKDGENNDEPPTEAVSQETSSSQIVECPVSTNNSNAHQLQVNEQDSLIETSITSLLTTSTGLEVVRGEVPNNSLDEPGGPLAVKTDLRQLPTSLLSYKRKTFTHKDDTLDDVSEITTDLTDFQSDSNSIPTSGRRLSQTSSDARAEGMSGSLESESKGSTHETEDKIVFPNKTSESNSGESKEDQSGDLDFAQEVRKENVPDDKDNGSNGEHGTCAKKVVKKRVSNGQSNEQLIQDKDSSNSRDQDLNQQQSVRLEDKEIAIKQTVHESYLRPVRPDLCSGSSQLMMEDDNIRGLVVHGDVEPVEELDISEHRDPPVHASESLSVEALEESNMSDQVREQNELDLRRQENDPIDNQNDEDLNNELDDSSAQDGLNNESDQGSNSDFQNFARGQYVGFRVDSTTTDSGIENSLAIFDRNNYQDVPDNSESNEASALGSSGASGLQNLQNWIERGASVNISRASSISPLPEVNEEIPGPSNLMQQQAGPSNFSAKYVKEKVLKVAQLEVIEDLPMECAEHFAETPSEGSILEIVPGIPSECEDLKTNEDHKIPQAVPSTEPDNIEIDDSKATLSSSKKGEELVIEKSSLKTDTKENSGVTEDKKSTDKEESFTTSRVTSIIPNTGQRLAKDYSDIASSSSQEQSRESSLADMDDAIESSDSLSKEAELPQTAENILQGFATSSPSLAKEPCLKPQRSKRRTRRSSENNSPYKKRKDIASCGQQASSLEYLKKQRPDSDDDSSKDDQKLQM